MKLLDVIPLGRAGALTARQLADILQLKRRTVTKNVEGLRLRGVPICGSSDADNGGFYIAADAAELEAYLAEREHRTRTIRASTTALRETLAKMRENEKPPSAETSPNNQH